MVMVRIKMKQRIPKQRVWQ